MKNNSFQPSEEQLQATNKVYKLRSLMPNDKILAAEIGITKVTLYTRLKVSNWKKAELVLIDSLTLD